MGERGLNLVPIWNSGEANSFLEAVFGVPSWSLSSVLFFAVQYSAKSL